MDGLLFRPIELQDRAWMEGLLQSGRRGSLEYSFTSNFIWRKVFRLEAARLDGLFAVLSDPDDPSYIFPAGSGPLLPLLRALQAHSEKKGRPLRFNTVLEEDRRLLEALCPGGFAFEALPDSRDYVYDAQSLISLAGRRFSGKRNHINRFRAEHPSWRYEPLSRGNIEEAHAMSLEWCRRAGCRDSGSLSDESCAVEQAFRHFFDLSLEGGLLRAEEGVVAFTMGEPLNEETYIIHVEKAFSDIQGAYQMINQLFAAASCGGFRYIDREDDAGDPGLRKAKLSYAPAFLVEKYRAELTGSLP